MNSTASSSAFAYPQFPLNAQVKTSWFQGTLLLKQVVVKDKMIGFAEHLINLLFEFNKFNYTGARMQGSIYNTTLKSHSFAIFASKHQDFAIRKHNIFMDVNA